MASLSKYIESCYYEDSRFAPIRTNIFDQGITHKPPRLLKEQKNRILLYPGAFNPPHRGHMELLVRAFTYSQDINVIAAIIIPLNDARESDSGAVMFRTIGFGCMIGAIQIGIFFRRELEACITRDGFELEFVGLLGPDYISDDASLPWNSWGCKSMVTSNVYRPASFLTSNKTLVQLRECEAWGPVVWNYSALTQFVWRGVSFAAGATALLAPTALLKELPQCIDPQYLHNEMHKLHQIEVDRMRDVSVCCRKGHPDETIRFIWSQEGGAALSSTRIRRTLTNYPARATSLSSMALNTDILANIMMSRKRDRTS
ncbi:hypothetical protein NQ176_g424 [Zarea fungicola]|uniref:Uncharacterized protein n=1 Tax=Zarea fungicola TaxID=93591 RepID=A0ACC1NWW2_9HYPO|nr:hypothetical protein NQ176_g424 [Lecanicillium fungicola]